MANRIEESVECHEVKETVDACVQQCFQGEVSGNKCIGFIVHENESCTLCQPKTVATTNVDILSHELFYILRKQSPKADVYLPLDHIFQNYQLSNGKSATVKRYFKNTLSLVAGKLDQAIHFNGGGGNLGIQLNEPDCFCNYHFCPEPSFTISFWFRIYSYSPDHKEIFVPSLTGEGLTIGK